MTFEQIEDGAIVYLDTNILVYDFNSRSADCSRLIQRCKEERVYGVVSLLTILEFCHRAMLMEAAEQSGREKVGYQFLEEHPEVVRKLRQYSEALDEVLQWTSSRIVEVRIDHVRRSQQIRDRYGLLTNDSVIAQLMLDYGIPAIATNDRDFDGVEGIHVYKPGDIRC